MKSPATGRKIALSGFQNLLLLFSTEYAVAGAYQAKQVFPVCFPFAPSSV